MFICKNFMDVNHYPPPPYTNLYNDSKKLVYE